MLAQIRISLIVLFLLSILTGFMYPLIVTGIAQIIFPSQANGSLIVSHGQILGSKLIGQQFDNPRYFWGRISTTSPFPYNASASSGSNLGPTNPVLSSLVKTRIAKLTAGNLLDPLPIPVDLATSSASGLDPDISIASALYQVPRVARARQLSEDFVRRLVQQYTDERQFGLLGEPVVNVLLLNLALDGIKY